MDETRPIVVTGASRGVGREIARQLIASGQEVIGIARHRPDLPESGGVRFIACDLSDLDAVAALTDQLRPLRPRGLINNAAVQSEADWIALRPAELARRFGAEITLDLVAPLVLGYGLIP